ncbi:hypothetical protein LTR17_015395 [Elasticomyces elasticus]|nr:hypothetical protein LTR17_015395 [Elasticomyces elasticus]
MQASGHLGPTLLLALQAAGFEVSAVTRASSSYEPPAGIRVIRTDFSLKALQESLQGQDAVVSAIGDAGLDIQMTLVDAAVAAGVRRYIPSNFGADYSRGVVAGFEDTPAAKKKLLDYIGAKATANLSFTWADLTTGLWIDWALVHTPELTGFDLANDTVSLWDSGNEPVATTILTDIGIAVVGLLGLPEDAVNRPFKVASMRTTQNEILAALRSTTRQQWDVKQVSTRDLLQKGHEQLEAGDIWPAHMSLIAVQLFEDGAGRGVHAEPGQGDCRILGLPVRSVESVVEVIVDAWM